MRMQVQSLALLSGLRIWHCLELWCRLQTWPDLVFLWLGPWPAAMAPIRLLAWESLYAIGEALKRQKTEKKRTQEQLSNCALIFKKIFSYLYVWYLFLLTLFSLSHLSAWSLMGGYHGLQESWELMKKNESVRAVSSYQDRKICISE